MISSCRGFLVIAAMAVVTASPCVAAADYPELGRLDPALRASVSGVIAEAEKDSLPTKPLIDKSLEGASKGASPERIVQAVRAYSQSLRRARSAVGAASTEAEIVAAAGAIQAGVSEDTLAEMRSARPRGSLVVPLVVLADMLARGVPLGAASPAVLAPARSGAKDADLFAIRERVERDIQAGVAPAAAAKTRSRAWLAQHARTGNYPGKDPR